MGDSGALVNSTIVYLCGLIDDDIDNKITWDEDAIEYLHAFEDFLRAGNGFNSLAPFRDFVIKQFPEDGWMSLLEKLSAHKDAVIKEIEADSYEHLKRARVQIGTTYGEMVAEIISYVSQDPLSSREVEALRLYSAGCTLLDNIADYYQDKLAKTPTHISLALEKEGANFFIAMAKEIFEANGYLVEARNLVDPKKREQYDDMVNLTKMFYGISFFKKASQYFLDPFIYTEGGVPFKIYKLKTMREKTPNDKALVDVGLREPVDYSRVTSTGSFMRRYWLDEVPQVINVLKGQMSIIGPRAVNYGYLLSLPEDVRTGRVLYKPGVADAIMPLMEYEGLDRENGEREYLSQRADSKLTNLRCLGLLLKGIISGRLKGI